MTRKVALYLRQSSDRSGLEHGIDRQREDCMRFITARGWTLTREYIDNDVSATNGKPRPQFTEMMKAVDAGEVDIIVSRHLDRLLRRLAELEQVLDRCQTVGAAIVTASDGIDTSTDGGRTTARILASVAQGEIERKSARQKSAAAQAAEQGRWVGGHRPFGYEADGVTVRDCEADLIRQGYDAILAGVPLSEIARRWATCSETSRGNKWTPQGVRDVLLNARNAGLRHYRSGRKQQAARRFNPDGGQISKADWPGLVDESTWRATCRILTDPARRRRSPTRSLLAGVIVCGVCDQPVARGGNGDGKPLYKCFNGTHVARNCELVDAFVEATILRVYRRPDVAHLFARDDAQVDVKALMARADVLRTRLRDVQNDYTDALITRDEWLDMRTRVQSNLAEVQSQLTQAGGSTAAARLLSAEDMQAEWDGYSLAAKRGLIGLLCTVVLQPAGRGARRFDPSTVQFRPKRKDVPIVV